ncbi:hypothetical protein L9F63_010088 [Diploptera punctata]|uniref:Protein AATF n=1 Tax=Diploptera punctata TaxID=6984 RepID=A0AAD8AI16_DIPPU|nr:hypothetical protein L9F63_010088 [Diploptera punctata]
MEQKQKNKSLSETFTDLINPAPLSFDPEFDHSETAAKVVENDYEEEEEEEEKIFSSNLRKRKFDFLEEADERYDGTKVSRKSLEMFDSVNNIEQSGEASVSSSEESDEDVDSYDSHNESEDGVVQNNVNSSYDEDKISSSKDDDFQHISKRSNLEVEKGMAVRNQLKLWDNLLEYRINLQKTLIAANKLPQHGIFQQFVNQGGSEFKSEVGKTRKNVASLLDKFVAFQSIMLNSYPETRDLDKVQNEASAEADEISSDTEEEEEISLTSEEEEDENKDQKKENYKTKRRTLQEYAKILSEQHDKYKSYRNTTIQKWNDKTRISVGKFSSRDFSSFEQSTVKQIEQVLSNRQRLIQRTQLKRSSYNILGQELIQESNNQTQESITSGDTNDLKNNHDQNKEYNSEIFDDSDFYHQLLRDLIEKKASDVTDPVQLGRQWLKLQKLRSKMKRKVDTKASKGRKIRYVVHPKLVNFMAPEDKSEWTEEAKTELFSSLFGNKR